MLSNITSPQRALGTSDMHSPIFLIGTQRSGTTLLGRMLSAHSAVFIKNELPVRLVFEPGAGRDRIQANIDRFVRERFGQGINELLAAEGKSVWGLKDPELTRYLDALEQFLPEARFIVITRDPRAVVNSYMENKWGLGTNAYTGALRWKQEVSRQLSFEAALPGYVLRVRYEDLVLDQETHLRRICRFLELPFEAEMMGYYQSKSFVSKNRENKNTFKAPDAALTTKWRRKLTPHQIWVFDSVVRPLLGETGYDDESDPYCPPPWLVFWYRLHQRVLGEIQIQYQWRVRRWLRLIRRRYQSARSASV